eukprot:7034896-Lingulodinium_polyedra.AAC.1
MRTPAFNSSLCNIMHSMITLKPISARVAPSFRDQGARQGGPKPKQRRPNARVYVLTAALSER